MSGGCAIESVQALFTLPTPLDSAQGRIWTGVAHDVRRGRKRKRPEIVVGVDGDSINVYNVRSSRLAVSHAISPQSYFTAPPCSIFSKSLGDYPSRRTYVAIRNDLERSNSHIHCYTHSPKVASSTEKLQASRSSSFSIQLGSRDNPIIHLDTVLNSVSSVEKLDESHELIAIQRNGNVTCLTEDLSDQRWSIDGDFLDSENTSQPGQVLVRYAAIETAQTAYEGFLKTRDDIVAGLSSRPSSAPTYILYLVTRPIAPPVDLENSETFWAFSFHAGSVQVGKGQSRFRILLNCNIPLSTSANSADNWEPSYDFNASTGILQQNNGQSLKIYDMSSGTVKSVSEFSESRSKLTSFLSISPYLSALSTERSCGIYNVRYQSRQASLSFMELVQSEHSRKRKRSRIEAPLRGLRFCQYFSNLKLAVGISGNTLLGMGLIIENKRGKKSINTTGRLIDSIGRGIKSLNEDEFIPNKRSLDEFARTKNTKSFERLFFGLIRQYNAANLTGDEPNQNSPKELDDGHSGHKPSKVILGNQIKQRLARYALQKTFQLKLRNPLTNEIQTDNPEAAIHVAFLSEEVFAWLSKNGHLTAEEIRTALTKDSPFAQWTDQISSGDLVRALSMHDPSQHLLSDLILSSSHLDLPGYIEATKILMQSFDPQPTPKAIENTNGNTGDDLAADSLEADLDAATTELALAQRTLASGAGHRATALRTILTRLPLIFAPGAIVTMLKAHLPTHALLQLVDLLRFELAQGGWTTRYVDSVYPAAIPPSPSQDSAIALICTLLNCALDALGTGGWLTGRSAAQSDDTSDEVDTLITFLRAETSATLEGVQEASFFKGFLKDFFRFSKSDVASKQQYDKQQQGLVSLDSPGVVAEPALTGAQDVMLPLGLKRASLVSANRVQAGGEVKPRSRREMKALISRQVGAYTFERIRV